MFEIVQQFRHLRQYITVPWYLPAILTERGHEAVVCALPKGHSCLMAGKGGLYVVFYTHFTQRNKCTTQTPDMVSDKLVQVTATQAYPPSMCNAKQIYTEQQNRALSSSQFKQTVKSFSTTCV